jgi:large subunit ribosomal protein L28
MYGRNVSFSKRHTSRVFKPNIQKTTVSVDGTAVSLKVCTRCLRTLTKTR